MKSKESSGLPAIQVDMRIGILDTIAKSIYAEPKVKIREAVANSMDNEASWFIMYMDTPSRSISVVTSTDSFPIRICDISSPMPIGKSVIDNFL